MKVYVVLTNAMNGTQYSGVFGTEEKAKQHIVQGVFGKNPRVVEFDVADVQESGTVYVAQTYSATIDAHEFEGVHGSYDGALRASGHKGQPLKVTL